MRTVICNIPANSLINYSELQRELGGRGGGTAAHMFNRDIATGEGLWVCLGVRGRWVIDVNVGVYSHHRKNYVSLLRSAISLRYTDVLIAL